MQSFMRMYCNLNWSVTFKCDLTSVRYFYILSMWKLYYLNYILENQVYDFNIWPFQTEKDMLGRLRVGSKERLTFFGQLQFNSLHSSHQEIKVRANFSHHLMVNRSLYSGK